MQVTRKIPEMAIAGRRAERETGRFREPGAGRGPKMIELKKGIKGLAARRGESSSKGPEGG
jgi:hypothetical protein